MTCSIILLQCNKWKVLSLNDLASHVANSSMLLFQASKVARNKEWSKLGICASKLGGFCNRLLVIRWLTILCTCSWCFADFEIMGFWTF